MASQWYLREVEGIEERVGAFVTRVKRRKAETLFDQREN
jgi:hypothetical protein